MSDEVDPDPKIRPAAAKSLLIVAAADAPLSPVQVEFNRLMSRLESGRARHEKAQSGLDRSLKITIEMLMPLVEQLNRLNCDIALTSWQALENLKLSEQRRYWFKDLIRAKITLLLEEPLGLSGDEVDRLEWVLEQLGPGEEEPPNEMEEMQFNLMRAMMEQTARASGVDLDLSDLDLAGKPAEFERIVGERLRAATEAAGGDPWRSENPTLNKSGRPRKQTQAQKEKERKRLEQEELKNRNIKVLYKQLAKVLHPDLETDPRLKLHKEEWMKRLTSAYKNGDLRDMLLLEMEWLGEESANLVAAGEEKLRVYCQVLKEQIAELRQQTAQLIREPQYGPLRRFIDPFTGKPENSAQAKRELQSQVMEYRRMYKTLAAGDAESRKMIQEWADHHAMIRGR